MDWFSRNFPTLSRLFSRGTRNKEWARRAAGDGPPIATVPAQGPDTEPVAGPAEHANSATLSQDTRPGFSPRAEKSVAGLSAVSETTSESWAPRHGGPVPQPSLDSALDPQLDEFYETWVGLEERLNRAQEQLRMVLANRKRAALLRDEARLVFAQTEAAWAEAQRLGEAAWRTFNQSFAEGLRDPASRWRFVKEIYEARMVQARLQRASNKDAWAEADRVREAATGELLKALSAIGAAAAQVERELREAASLPPASEALRLAALEDLRYAQGLGGDRDHLGPEAVDQLDAARITEQAPAQPDRGSPPPKYPEPALRRLDNVTLGEGEPAPPAATPGGPGTLAREHPVLPTVQSRETPIRSSAAGTSSPVPASSPGNSPTSAAEALRKEMEAAAARMNQQQNRDAAAEGFKNKLDPPGPKVEAPAASGSTATEELARELASLRDLFAAPSPPQGGITQPPGAGSTAPRVFDGDTATSKTLSRRIGTPDKSEGLSERLPGSPPAPGARPAGPGGSERNQVEDSLPTHRDPDRVGRQVGGFIGADLSKGGPGVAPSQALPAVYAGRLYLMFPSTISQDGLESVWEALEKAAGMGAIVDTQLISREAGIQFTVDLGNRQLVVEEMRKLMPGAGITQLGADRLKVDWQPRR